MNGKHLQLDDRAKIEVLVKIGQTPAQIAKLLNCSLRTVYYELRRGKCTLLNGDTWEFYDSYSAQIAQDDYDSKSTAKGAHLKIGHDYALAAFLEHKIGKERYSPAAALAEAKRAGYAALISKTTLYRYIYDGLFLHIDKDSLPFGHYKRRNRHGDVKARPNYTHAKDKLINERPKAAATRQEFGHWEMDTVVGRAKGKNKVLLVLTERKTRFEIVFRIRAKTSKAVTETLFKLRRRFGSDYKKIFRTITCDNGTEFSDVLGMECLAPVYFCHPYSSWERGSNENQNKLIRRFIPKGQDMNKLTLRAVAYIQHWMNHYPRNLLGWQTPADRLKTELLALNLQNREKIFAFLQILS